VKVRAATEKNFRRVRSKPTRRRKLRQLFSWRMARRVLIVLVVVVGGYRAFDLALNASVLRVNKIRVHGNVRLSSGEVQTLVRDLRGSNILTADLSGYRRVLLRSPWVSGSAFDVFCRQQWTSTSQSVVHLASAVWAVSCT